MDFIEQRLWVNIKLSILSHVYMTYIYGIDIAKCLDIVICQMF